MKIEFLHHYRQRHGLRPKDRLVAYLPRLAPQAARMAGLANLRETVPGMRRAGERLFGLSARRSLPRWRRDVFRPSEATPTDQPDLVLLPDTFTTYFEPENARAALRVLEAAGYRVTVPVPPDGRPLCCGRTFLAAGLVDEARNEARRVLDTLAPYVERGLPVVGLEPACLLTLRDEFLAMLPGESTSALAERAVLLEEFLATAAKPLPLRPSGWRRALVHGHCHQKAFGAMGAVEKTLRQVPGLEVGVIESSCCGMAGAFGYEARHHEVSMRMAERDLLPAVRAAGPDTVLVADGTSCRHQIRDGAGREAVHVARVLEAALA
jgi:Fe-S oxidoreductase